MSEFQENVSVFGWLRLRLHRHGDWQCYLGPHVYAVCCAICGLCRSCGAKHPFGPKFDEVAHVNAIAGDANSNRGVELDVQKLAAYNPDASR